MSAYIAEDSYRKAGKLQHATLESVDAYMESVKLKLEKTLLNDKSELTRGSLSGKPHVLGMYGLEAYGTNQIVLNAEASDKGYKSNLWLTKENIETLNKGRTAASAIKIKDNEYGTFVAVKIPYYAEITHSLETNEKLGTTKLPEKYTHKMLAVYNTDQVEGLHIDRLQTLDETQRKNLSNFERTYGKGNPAEILTSQESRSLNQKTKLSMTIAAYSIAERTGTPYQPPFSRNELLDEIRTFKPLEVMKEIHKGQYKAYEATRSLEAIKRDSGLQLDRHPQQIQTITRGRDL